MVFVEPPKREGNEIILSITGFISICPRTGNEDKANIEIRYVPGEIQIDRYTLKKYLDLFRDKEIYMEVTPINILDFCVNYCLTHAQESSKSMMEAVPKRITIKTTYYKPKRMNIEINFNRE